MPSLSRDASPHDPFQRRADTSRFLNGFDVTVEHRGEGVVAVLVAGEVDVTAAGVLRERLIDLFAQGGVSDELVVDLTQVAFIDSTGLGVLVGAAKRAAAAGARMSVVASAPARRAIRITGLDQLWNVQDAPAE